MILLAIALQAATASPPTCTAYDGALPAALAGWRTPGGIFETGGAVTVAATDPASVVPPQKPGKVASLRFTIARAGAYRVALDQPGWIDVRRADAAAPLASIAHGHGPECSTIKKLVAYDLAAGSYVVTFSGLARPALRTMLVPGKQ